MPLAFHAPEQTNLPLPFCPVSGSFHPFCPSPCLLPFPFAFLSYLSLSVLLRVCLFLVRALSTSAPYQSRCILPLASLPRPFVLRYLPVVPLITLIEVSCVLHVWCRGQFGD